MSNQTSDETREKAAPDEEQASPEPEHPDQTEAGSDEETPESETQELTLEQALDKLQQVEVEAAQAREDLLRVQAEMQNLRRRTEQDVEKAHKFALERFSTELLPVLDNLERASSAAGDHDDPVLKAIHEGVDLTLKSFADVFRKFSIEAVDPHGEPFDPQLHQAMLIQENAEVEPDTVLNVMQKGYTLHGRVLRPAMVIVSRAAGEKSEDNQ